MNSGIEVRFVGRLAKEPQRVTSRTGTVWTRLSCDVPCFDTDHDEPAMTWLRVGIPGERGDEFMSLEIGAEIRVVGMLCLNTYSKNGRPQIGMSVIPSLIERVQQ